MAFTQYKKIADVLADFPLKYEETNFIQPQLFGIVSNGKIWEFGRLREDIFLKNKKFYVLEYLTELMAAINYLFATILSN